MGKKFMSQLSPVSSRGGKLFLKGRVLRINVPLIAAHAPDSTVRSAPNCQLWSAAGENKIEKDLWPLGSNFNCTLREFWRKRVTGTTLLQYLEGGWITLFSTVLRFPAMRQGRSSPWFCDCNDRAVNIPSFSVKKMMRLPYGRRKKFRIY